ncbi:MAG TPA: neutral zinc metallopeptidase [Thermoanaerobaculaceae bacterium]|nr:neutral zinc metallopeptidase [Thermoanaerobaculaceae bacterium]
MRWKPGGRSEDLEDVRDEGGGAGFRIRGPHLGIGGFLLLLVLSLLLKRDFFSLLGVTGMSSPSVGTTTSQPVQRGPEDEKEVQFISFVLDDVQKTWSQAFAQANQEYPHAKLVLFSDVTRSGCGFAEGASGPFYCPEDQKVYIDLSFFDELKARFGAPGEFAQAYVIAHEVGHHVQNLLGIDAKVRQMQARDPSRANELSVRLELQGDCLAGVWGYSTEQRDILEQGDVESGLAAAAAVGDDRIQRQAGGRVNPERWTHGSSEQRVAWFRRGLSTGRMDACDTFSARH